MLSLSLVTTVIILIRFIFCRAVVVCLTLHRVFSADDKVAYIDLAKTAEKAWASEKPDTLQPLRAVFEASVVPQDWIGQEGSASLNEFADSLSKDDLEKVVGEMARFFCPDVSDLGPEATAIICRSKE